MNKYELGTAGCVLTALGVAGTVLWFAHQTKTADPVLADRVSLAIVEPETAKAYEGGILTGLFPGQTVDMRASVALSRSSEAAYIRVWIEYGGALAAQEEGSGGEEEAAQEEGADGEEEPAKEEGSGGEEEAAQEAEERLRRIRQLEEGIVLADGWLKGQDGACYYQGTAAPGSSTPFLEQVVIPESWGNEIAEQTFSIELISEGIPADCFDPWSEDENGDPVIVGWYYGDGTPVSSGR